MQFKDTNFLYLSLFPFTAPMIIGVVHPQVDPISVEITLLLLDLTIISENDRKFTSHSNADNLRTSFPPSGMNTSARFHRWYNDNSVVRFPLSSSNTLIIQGGDISQWFIDGSTTDAI
ncbi:macro domain-containing protein XCC3184-like, partial [Trifolium medium]|nr:macro domain-containing protein XCC3184-like [Trifolium medium]